MVVTWTTFASTNGVVQYSAEGSNIWLNATAETRLFVDGGSEHTKRYIQRAHLPSLKPSTRYSELFKKYFCFIDVLDVVLSSMRIWLICNPLITFVGYRVGMKTLDGRLYLISKLILEQPIGHLSWLFTAISAMKMVNQLVVWRQRPCLEQ